eukprot:GFUD01043857.1.p1 GENE.GFUD01043857.1~~GFUD01043857.1.p1  ORF type:complete len:516 (-),score=103.37 GFUD01043857.1:52-1509(-)
MERETEEMMKDSEELLKESEEFENLLQEFKKQSLSIDLIKCILSRLSLSEKIAVDHAMSSYYVAGEKVTVKIIELAMIMWSVTQEDEDFERVKKMIVEGKTELNERYPVKAHGKTLNLSPLHTAVYLQSPQLVDLFMTSDGVDVGLKFETPEHTEDVGNVLDLAFSMEIRNESSSVVQSILENDKDCRLVTNNALVATLLHYAKYRNKMEVWELLFGYEAARPGLSPLGILAFALCHNDLDLFIKILPRGKARLNTIVPKPCPCCSSPTFTLLHLAICMNNLKVVRLLLKAGSDVNSSEGQLGGILPLMQAIETARHRGHCGKGKCQDRVITELLSTEGIDLDIQMGEKTTALDLINNCTCPSTKQMVEQAYTRHSLRKKMMKRREDQGKDEPAKGDPTKADQTNDDLAKVDQAESDQVKVSKHKREKICWNCRSLPTSNKLYRCAGCHVAWYCGGITCQKEDWSRHSGWCVLKEQRRKEKDAQK